MDEWSGCGGSEKKPIAMEDGEEKLPAAVDDCEEKLRAAVDDCDEKLRAAVKDGEELQVPMDFVPVDFSVSRGGS